MKAGKLEAGMGATEQFHSDAHAYTVVEVRSPTEIVVQRDIATRTDKNGMSDAQSYEYAPDPDGEKKTVSLRPDGVWREKGRTKRNAGSRFIVGRRHEYYDYSF